MIRLTWTTAGVGAGAVPGPAPAASAAPVGPALPLAAGTGLTIADARAVKAAIPVTPKAIRIGRGSGRLFGPVPEPRATVVPETGEPAVGSSCSFAI